MSKAGFQIQYYQTLHTQSFSKHYASKKIKFRITELGNEQQYLIIYTVCLFPLNFFPQFSGVSHSVLADMQTIQQEKPTMGQSSSRSRKYSEEDDEEEGYFFIR